MKKVIKGAAAVFVKTPGVSPLKTRLAQGVGTELAEEFHRCSCLALEKVLEEVSQQIKLQPYWAVAEQTAIDHPLWQGLKCMGQGDGPLGDRLDFVYKRLIQEYDYVLLLGADSPQLKPSILHHAHKLLTQAEENFVLGPAQDGGYYLFGGNHPIAKSIWTSIPYSQNNTGQKMEMALKGQGTFTKLESLFDVDTVAEWHQLADLLTSPLPSDGGTWNSHQQKLGLWMKAQSIE